MGEGAPAGEVACRPAGSDGDGSREKQTGAVCRVLRGLDLLNLLLSTHDTLPSNRRDTRFSEPDREPRRGTGGLLIPALQTRSLRSGGLWSVARGRSGSTSPSAVAKPSGGPGEPACEGPTRSRHSQPLELASPARASGRGARSPRCPQTQRWPCGRQTVTGTESACARRPSGHQAVGTGPAQPGDVTDAGLLASVRA